MDLLKETAAKRGIEVRVARFARFQVGEGLAKRSDDLAAEVAKQLNRG
jgi:elongation factor Ts